MEQLPAAGVHALICEVDPETFAVEVTHLVRESLAADVSPRVTANAFGTSQVLCTVVDDTAASRAPAARAGIRMGSLERRKTRCGQRAY